MAGSGANPGDLWFERRTKPSPPQQGDLHWAFPVIVSEPTSGTDAWGASEYREDLIVATQSCDLEQGKVRMVLAAPFYPLSLWLKGNPGDLGRLDDIAKGHESGLYLLPFWQGDPRLSEDQVVNLADWRTISLDQCQAVTANDPDRVGLRSPSTEHFAQAVARSFMRVGLPMNINSFDMKSAGKPTQQSILTWPAGWPSDLPALQRQIQLTRQERIRDATNEHFFIARLEAAGQTIDGAGRNAAAADSSLQEQIRIRWAAAKTGNSKHVWMLDVMR